MRLGVLSDLHANLPALEAALEALRAEAVDEVLVLGDLVGYGPHPRQVIHRIWEEGLAAIAGAWDLRVAYPLPGPLPEGVGKATLEWTRAQLGEKELAYLRSLRLSHRRAYGRMRLVAFHGKPGDPEERVDLLGPARDLAFFLEQSGAEAGLAPWGKPPSPGAAGGEGARRRPGECGPKPHRGARGGRHGAGHRDPRGPLPQSALRPRPPAL